MQEVISNDEVASIDIIQNIEITKLFTMFGQRYIEFESLYNIQKEEEKQQSEGRKTKLSLVTPSVWSKQEKKIEDLPQFDFENESEFEILIKIIRWL